MKIQELFEANLYQRLQDPKLIKQLAIAFRHDHSIPLDVLSRMGPKPSEEKVFQVWSEMVDRALARSDFGDLSRDGKYDMWLAKLYATGATDYESISGEGVDLLGKFRALGNKKLLKPEHQDLNRIGNFNRLELILQTGDYPMLISKIKNEEKIKAMRKSAQSITLINDDRFQITVPMNYGACYMFNYTGHVSNYCTGGSSGNEWYDRYSRTGVIVSIIDKENANTVDGKWQIHAETNQIVNSLQQNRHDTSENVSKFRRLFPGLLERIIGELNNRSEEIQNATGHSGATEAARIRMWLPASTS